MKKYDLRFLVLLLLLVVQNARAQELPAFVRDSLDGAVKRALAEWKIPGVSVAIVKDGKAVLLRGYGVREAGGTDPVDENTLFMIGSNTKAFTATALAMLDAKKRIALDSPVIRYLPDFRLYDPWVTTHATVRDLLCHRLGFETFQGDFMYFDSDLSLEEVRQRFGRVKPLYGFRSRWGYTNAAFMTAGEIIPRVTGRSWAQFIRDSLFAPLDMKRSLVLSSDMQGAENRASAHTLVNGELKMVAYCRLENMAPAGAIASSASDLSHWMLMQLANGMYGGKQVMPAEAIIQTRTPASILGRGGALFNKGHYQLYGLGWFLEEYAGREVVSHTGGVNGFVTSVTLVPEENLGIVVLTNTDANLYYEALKREILDACLGLPFRNYDSVLLGFQSRSQADDRQWLQSKRDSVALNPKPALPLSAFTGTYRHEVYGNMTLALEEGKLVARFEHHKGRYATLEALGGNRFLASFNDPLYGNKVWPFTITGGKVRSVTVTVADFVEFTPYEFVKTK